MCVIVTKNLRKSKHGLPIEMYDIICDNMSTKCSSFCSVTGCDDKYRFTCVPLAPRYIKFAVQYRPILVCANDGITK